MLTKAFRIGFFNVLLCRLSSVIDELRVRLAVFVIAVDVIEYNPVHFFRVSYLVLQLIAEADDPGAGVLHFILFDLSAKIRNA